MSELVIKKFYEEGYEALNNRADAEIEKNRKGDFKITLVDECGNPVKNANVTAIHKVHDFDFGSNIFMLDQYDEPEKNALYLEKWMKIFNTAVVPMYWQGTEPKQGYLRYDEDAANDVYRRPAPSKVIKYCEENAIRTKGHPIYWHEFSAPWLPQSFEESKPLIEKRIKELASRYDGRVPVFDCVNEPGRIWDVEQDHLNDDWPHQVPGEGYIEWVFKKAAEYFPNTELILNEATGMAFSEFHGYFGCFYLLIKQLLSEGIKIDRIGLQCHTDNREEFKNVFNADRMYKILDTYATFGKPLVLSEVSVPSKFQGDILDPQFQADATEMLYKVAFSHKAMTGIFWWNLTDDGTLNEKRRVALGENIPTSGLIDLDYNEKPAYNVVDNLINNVWRTNISTVSDDEGNIAFRGFYGEYEVTVNGKATRVKLSSDGAEVVVRV